LYWFVCGAGCGSFIAVGPWAWPWVVPCGAGHVTFGFGHASAFSGTTGGSAYALAANPSNAVAASGNFSFSIENLLPSPPALHVPSGFPVERRFVEVRRVSRIAVMVTGAGGAAGPFWRGERVGS
jgi:hypothetical protein